MPLFPETGFSSHPAPTTKISLLLSVLITTPGLHVRGGSGGKCRHRHHRVVALAGYFSNAQLDTTFGTGGRVVTAGFGNNTVVSISAIALQADAKIVAVGTVGSGHFAVARYVGQ